MKTESVEIVDLGRGPQLSTSRITVLDVFYYLHRGHDFHVIQQAMPSLSGEEFDVILAYLNAHHKQLVEDDLKAEEFIRKGINAQRARGGIFAGPDESLSPEQRAVRLKDILKEKMAEENGKRHPG